MKKTLLTIALAGFLSLNSCIKNTKNENLPRLENNSDNKMIIYAPKEKINFSKEEITNLKGLTKKNELYLEGILEHSEFFNNHFDLAQAIVNYIKHKTPTIRVEKNDKNTVLTEDFSQVYDLSLSQNQIIYLMLKSLKNQNFINKIGQIIEEDVKDKYAEHGGIIQVSKNLELELKTIPSEDTKDKLEENNSFYNLPDWAENISQIAKFHLHAMNYDESKFAGPGEQDLIGTNSLLDITGKTNEFIITSLKKGKFNIDYFGGDKLIHKKVKIIDLGNYEYYLQK